MVVLYYTGDRWRTSPHLLIPHLSGWHTLILRANAARFNWADHQSERGVVWFWKTIERWNDMGAFSNAFEAHEAGNPNQAFSDPDFATKWPTLHAFLTQVQDDSGKPRKTSTVLIFTEDGHAKAVLKERDHDLSLWVTSGSLLGVFEALEEALQKRPIDWRKNQTDRKWKK